MIDFQNFTEYFKQLPIILKIIWVLIFLLSISILGLILYLKKLRINLRANEKKFVKFQKIYEEILINYLYAGDEENKISTEQEKLINKIKREIKSKFKRNIIISVMSKLIDDISGEMADSIILFYFETGLINHSLKKLKSNKWNIVASGIKELAQFKVTDVNDEIIKHIKHPNREVRNEAQLYLVGLFHFKGLEFLDNFKTPLSEWDQIQLLETLQNFDNQEIPNISPWLKSENHSVVKFALKLARIYNQFDVIDTLLELLKHENQEIRVQAINVLGYFQDTNSKDFLKNNFVNASEEEQIAFFKLLENSADSNDETFILEHIKSDVFEIKLAAFKILKINNFEKFQEVKLIMEDEQSIEIVKFLENN